MKFYYGNKGKMPKEQVLFYQTFPHEGTIIGALIWWLRRKNKHCRSFCPLCEYYFRCQEDVCIENI